MSFSERMRDMVRNWLRIEPAAEQSATIRETVGYAANCMRNRVWYRGDAGEIEQLFRALDGGSYLGGTARFWAKAPSNGEVRKAHSGLPAILVDTLAYLVKSDLNDVEFEEAPHTPAGVAGGRADRSQMDLHTPAGSAVGMSDPGGGTAAEDVLADGSGETEAGLRWGDSIREALDAAAIAARSGGRAATGTARAARTADTWAEIAADCRWTDVVGEAVSGVLTVGDGAFKISIDEDVSPYPLLEFWPGDRVEYLRRHGRIVGVVFKTVLPAGGGGRAGAGGSGGGVYGGGSPAGGLSGARSVDYELHEIYEPGSIRYELWRDGRQVPLSALPELAEYRPVTYDEKFPLAVPLCVFHSQKYPGRGRSIFDGKTDAFDAHDEVISQWIDAVRHGRVKNYIPEDMIPRDPATGELKHVDSFGTNFIQVASSHAEGAAGALRIETVQPEIRYDAFVKSYAATLNLCLQGIVSPATLGIDVGRMSSAEAQREKKDITGMTRNAITDALEKALPQVVRSMLMAYDLLQGRAAGQYEPKVTFGEYGAPDFDSRVQTVASAATAGVMSVEAVVDELWGASKDAEWKAAEVRRILAERGIEQAEEPGVGSSVGTGMSDEEDEADMGGMGLLTMM